jgi:hypothetical protein
MKKVIVSSLTAPHGTIMESLRIEHERRIVGRVTSGPCPLGWYEVEFPTVANMKPLDVHRDMLTPVR